MASKLVPGSLFPHWSITQFLGGISELFMKKVVQAILQISFYAQYAVYGRT